MKLARLTIRERIEAFKAAFAEWPASWPWVVREQDRDVLYATWVLGNDYRNKTRYYGAYPPGYLKRVMALFPAAAPTLRERRDDHTPILHAFSGSLPAGPYVRLDINAEMGPDVVGSVYQASKLFLGGRPFSLVIADPAYSAADSAEYGTQAIDRGRATAALADVTKPGGHMVWLDTCWPMHRKTHWRTVGRITLVRSTNHRVRMATIFERAG